MGRTRLQTPMTSAYQDAFFRRLNEIRARGPLGPFRRGGHLSGLACQSGLRSQASVLSPGIASGLRRNPISLCNKSGIDYKHTRESVSALLACRMTRCSLWLFILVLIGPISYTSCSSDFQTSKDGEEFLAFADPVTAQQLFPVKRVYDGDTILLEDGRKVRYLGINAPEFQEPFYLKAKRLNESLVLGREIRLEFDQERAESFDRVLAYVYVGDEMVNARLVQEGLAHAFFVGPSRKHNALLLRDRKSTRLNSSHIQKSRMPSSA